MQNLLLTTDHSTTRMKLGYQTTARKQESIQTLIALRDTVKTIAQGTGSLEITEELEF